MAERWNTFLEEATVTVLKEKLRQLNCVTTGNKAVLKLRLEDTVKDYTEEELLTLIPTDFLEHQNGGEINDENDVEQELDGEIEKLKRLVEKKKQIANLKKEIQELQMENVTMISKTQHQFRDIEDSMPTFSGDDNFPIKKWIEQFEEHCTIFNFDEKTKFVFGKRLLCGTAKLFMRTVSLKNWKELKDALLKEFSRTVTIADIHNDLRNRKKRRDETFQQFVLSMQEIAETGSIDKADLIVYIIRGIQYNEVNKMILYSAYNLNELK